MHVFSTPGAGTIGRGWGTSKNETVRYDMLLVPMKRYSMLMVQITVLNFVVNSHV